ncbi:hypothetical protein ACFQL1_19345 [Halomicroarcula sp. GCM10025709]|uniref:hypothetical protein n=1 Tax=Haloarcula TaxID=2237 RepID=UPI0024C39CC3|nr:hypothetical protein [Halomicroarcula sp. YJ-61-S]
MRDNRLHTVLWAAFCGLFAVFAGAVALPVRPLVGVLPAWAVVIGSAIVTMAAVAAAVARAGWPARPGESPR